MAHECRHVERGAAALQHVEVLRHGLEVPTHAGAQYLERHAFDLREFTSCGRARGTAMVKPQLPMIMAVTPSAGEEKPTDPAELRVGARVAVDDPRHQGEAVGVHRLGGAAPLTSPTATMRPSFTASAPRLGGDPSPSSSSASRITRSNTA